MRYELFIIWYTGPGMLEGQLAEYLTTRSFIQWNLWMEELTLAGWDFTPYWSRQ